MALQPKNRHSPTGTSDEPCRLMHVFTCSSRRPILAPKAILMYKQASMQHLTYLSFYLDRIKTECLALPVFYYTAINP